MREEEGKNQIGFFDPDPAKLMRLAKNGDKEAFENIYELYFVPIYRFIFFQVKNKEQAEDLTQTTFLKVFEKISVFQNKSDSPASYFFMVARNLVIDFWRKKKEVILNGEKNNTESFFEKQKSEEKNPEEQILKKEANLSIRERLEILTESEREMIVMKFINDLSNREIAKLTGKKEDAIRQAQSRAFRKLRNDLKKNNPEKYE